MVKIIMGQRGTGKSKKMIELANNLLNQDSGDIVFINNNSRHMYDLNHDIRFIDISEFEIEDYCMCYGFICGVISEDFDISQIFIDGISEISDDKQNSFQQFLNGIQKISEKFDITFTLAVDGDVETAPKYVKEYIV